MNPDPPTSHEGTSPTQLVEINRICDRFEEAWREGPRPAIENYWSATSEPARSDLLLELMLIELEWRRSAGERPTAAEYHARFLDHSAAVEAACARAGLDVALSLSDEGASASASGDVDIPGPKVNTPTHPGRRFRVLRPHAEGGLGAVFVALDSELNREVALKQILEKRADDLVLRARFLMEAEITGRLEHPGIVPVYGLGTYSNGRPYYAMRFIRGDTLKDAITAFHADPALKTDPGRHSLELAKLLRRFLDVCNAIEYAHSRGVLHRDLKPSNVVVGKYGETLVVDWGLAKPLGARDSESPTNDEQLLPPSSLSGSADTLPGSVLGTPSYMSPEQAAGRLDDLGPASDVYGLGTTLYFLLAGRDPFERGEIESVLKRVRIGEFPRPREVNPRIDPALEAICLRAMARVPEDRYASARSMADEIERWLADEPVTAWREPLMRRVRRWARRHRLAVTAAAASLVVALAASVAIAVIQSLAVERERVLTENESKAKTLALTRLGQVEKANELLGSIFKDLDPRAERKGHKPLRVILGERLSLAAASLKGEATGDPLTVAMQQDILGTSQNGLGNTAEAITLLTQASRTREAMLGPSHPDTLDSRNNLADAYATDDRPEEAIPIHEVTLKARETTLGLNHPDTLKTKSALAFDFYLSGRLEEAVAMNEETLKAREIHLGIDHPDTLESRVSLAAVYSEIGYPDKAIAMYQEALKRYEANFGPEHPDTLAARAGLALAFREAARAPEAIVMLEATVKSQESRLGFDHPETLTSRVLLAASYKSAGQMPEAIALYQELLKVDESKYGLDDPVTLDCRMRLGESYLDANRAYEAIEVYEATLKLCEIRFGHDGSQTLSCRSRLADAYRIVGRLAEAITLLEATLKSQEEKLGFDNYDRYPHPACHSLHVSGPNGQVDRDERKDGEIPRGRTRPRRSRDDR